MNPEQIEKETREVFREMMEQLTRTEGRILIIGCSTSEVVGEKIGSAGSEGAANAILKVVMEFAAQYKFYPAFQCCEHLNRSIVVEGAVREKFLLEEVNAVPVRQAGGAMAEAAYKGLANPCLVEEIRGDFGIDIGMTLIGMHLKKVVVPVRLKNDRIGNAKVVFAKTRPKYVGGERAVYNASLKK